MVNLQQQPTCQQQELYGSLQILQNTVETRASGELNCVFFVVGEGEVLRLLSYDHSRDLLFDVLLLVLLYQYDLLHIVLRRTYTCAFPFRLRSRHSRVETSKPENIA